MEQPLWSRQGDALTETNADEHTDESELSNSAMGIGEASRSSRLARKAESARQARLRHKQYVNELQEHVATLRVRLRSMEQMHRSQTSASTAIDEIKRALTPEQFAQLGRWLHCSQGENHTLRKYALPDSPPPLPQAPRHPLGVSSTPIAIRGMHGQVTSPMESDDDTFTMDAYNMSRSWDDIEGARSILNLNSPSAFHPVPEHAAHTGAVSSFSLPSAAASAASSFPNFVATNGSAFHRPSRSSFGIQQAPPPSNSHQGMACTGIKTLADAVGVAPGPASSATAPFPSFTQTGGVAMTQSVQMGACSGAVAT